MRSELTCYLVDDLGKPLSMRYQAAVERLRRAFLSGFPKPSDPAEISNAVEETARRVARYETQRGEVEILLPFLLKTYLNVVRSMSEAGITDTGKRQLQIAN